MTPLQRPASADGQSARMQGVGASIGQQASPAGKRKAASVVRGAADRQIPAQLGPHRAAIAPACCTVAPPRRAAPAPRRASAAPRQRQRKSQCLSAASACA